MFQKARDNSVPLDTIERAIKRGTGELEGVTYESVTYEGYAPGGVALLIETLTDNRNRTGAEVRSILTRNGGSLAEPGAVAWQFSRRGTVTVPRSLDEEELMLLVLEAGADDLLDEGEVWRIYCDPSDLTAVRAALDDAGIEGVESDLLMVPSATVPLDSAADAKKVLGVVEALDDHDDVQTVSANFDIPDEVIEAVSA
jgi:YebC/PmpR family DNA-binding regulatory protein